MRSKGSEASHTPLSPVRVFMTVLAVVFLTEAAIMLALRAAPERCRDYDLASLIDALALVGVVSPVLWILVVRPLRRLVRERGELLSLAMSIQEEERERIAHDLHDEVGQVQTALLLASRAVMNAQTPEQASERARLVHSLAVEAMESTRRMARGLSPSVLTDFGLAQACERVCEDLSEASGVPIIRTFSIGEARFSSRIEIAAYRVLQEGVANAVRHANASEISVTLDIVNDELVLEVNDDGRGLDAAPRDNSQRTGLGLAGMRERVVLLGGRFEVHSNQTTGTSLRARFPAEMRDEPAEHPDRR